MSIKDVRIYLTRNSSKIVAMASCAYYDLCLKKLKVIKGSNGLFVAFPADKVEDRYDDIYFPLSADLRKELSEKITTAYNKKLAAGDPDLKPAKDDQLPF